MHHKGLKILIASGAPIALAFLTAPLFGAPGDDEVVGPGAAPADVDHPDRERPVTPRYGGRAIVHISTLPENICYPIENSAVTRRLLYEVHETLLIQDWEWHDYRPRVAREYVIEDLVVFTDDARSEYSGSGVIDAKIKRREIEEGQPRHRLVRAVYGTVTEADGNYVVTPASKGNPLSAPIEIPAAHVETVERGSVFTFTLRDDVLWHPSEVFREEHPEAFARLAGHKVDARDVLFSWEIYSNPSVDCDEKRFVFEMVTHGEIIDPLTVRFFFEQQYFKVEYSLGKMLTLLPSHIYDLSDPDNPAFVEHFTAEEQGEHINGNPHNQMWVGLGPYRVTKWTQQYVQAERFADEDGKCLYFDRSNAGYFDTIRWRLIDDDETAMNAVLNGELDFFERIKSADYFGTRTESEQFKKNYYKGHKYLGIFGYTGWNMYRPQLKELAVRQAIAHAFDFEEWKRTHYEGLCRQVSGSFPYNSAAYDHSVEPFPYDPDKAVELLEDAGWYDRDGDGIRDKEGVTLEIDFLMPSGNDASKLFGLRLQESLADLEIKLNIVQMEWATFLEKIKSRQFDAANLAWVPPLESDPEQLWHSKWGKYEARGSNNSGVMDPHVDRLIEAGQRELDFKKRMEIWHQIHRRLYQEIQPYLFMYNIPRKFAMNKKMRGFQKVAIDPGYVIRRWYYWDPEQPGTRTTLDR